MIVYFAIIYYVPVALYYFDVTGGRHGLRDDDGHLPEDYFKEHTKHEKDKKNFAKEFSKKLHITIFKNINIKEIEDKFRKLNLRPEDKVDRKVL